MSDPKAEAHCDEDHCNCGCCDGDGKPCTCGDSCKCKCCAQHKGTQHSEAVAQGKGCCGGEKHEHAEKHD